MAACPAGLPVAAELVVDPGMTYVGEIGGEQHQKEEVAEVPSPQQDVQGEQAQQGERLTHAEPAALKELFRGMVERITCQWEKIAPTTPKGRPKNVLIGGVAELKPLSVFARAGARVSTTKQSRLPFSVF